MADDDSVSVNHEAYSQNELYLAGQSASTITTG